MAPKQKYEFIIIRLIHKPDVNPMYPRISTSTNRSSPNSMSPLRGWFERVLDVEKSFLPVNVNVRYVEWKIITGDIDIFALDRHRFNHLFIVVGENRAHWAYYHTFPYQKRLEGSGVLPISFCGCCISSQYNKIAKVVREKTKPPSRFS